MTTQGNSPKVGLERQDGFQTPRVWQEDIPSQWTLVLYGTAHGWRGEDHLAAISLSHRDLGFNGERCLKIILHSSGISRLQKANENGTEIVSTENGLSTVMSINIERQGTIMVGFLPSLSTSCSRKVVFLPLSRWGNLSHVTRSRSRVK